MKLNSTRLTIRGSTIYARFHDCNDTKQAIANGGADWASLRTAKIRNKRQFSTDFIDSSVLKEFEDVSV